MKNIVTENEKNYPDLKRLLQVVKDKTRSDADRWLSACCYAGIAYALYNNRQGKFNL